MHITRIELYIGFWCCLIATLVVGPGQGLKWFLSALAFGLPWALVVLTRHTDEEREKWTDDERKRCESCGLEPEQCRCDKDLDEVL